MACIDHGYKGDKDGYGCVNIGGKFRRLHRIAYAQHHGLDLSQWVEWSCTLVTTHDA